jgi:hypothetical protein
MLKRDQIENTLIAAAQRQGIELNDMDLLDIRTGVAASLAAKERHHQRMGSPTYQWAKPSPRR